MKTDFFKSRWENLLYRQEENQSHSLFEPLRHDDVKKDRLFAIAIYNYKKKGFLGAGRRKMITGNCRFFRVGIVWYTILLERKK